MEFDQIQFAKSLSLVIDENVPKPVIRSRLKAKIRKLAKQGKLTRNFLNNTGRKQIEWAYRIFSANQMLGIYDWWGWECRSEWAWRLANTDWKYPRWDGKPCKLLVIAEQGIGDEILFASCFKELQAENPDLTIECDDRLMPIFERSFPGIKFVTRWADKKNRAPWELSDYRGDYDAFMPAGSIPSIYRRSKSSFPRTPYLVPRETTKRGGTGIVFRAGVDGSKQIDYRILGGDVCLQHDEDLPGYKNPSYSHNKFDDYIDLIASLDKVVAVPSAVIHIAGAIGTPCEVVKPWKERTNMSVALKWYYPNNRDVMDWYDVRIHQNPRNYAKLRAADQSEGLAA
jgi:hypothetical protein